MGGLVFGTPGGGMLICMWSGGTYGSGALAWLAPRQNP